MEGTETQPPKPFQTKLDGVGFERLQGLVIEMVFNALATDTFSEAERRCVARPGRACAVLDAVVKLAHGGTL